jgi:hypothetical protein
VVVDEELLGCSDASGLSDLECHEIRKNRESLRGDAETTKIYVLFMPYMADHPRGEKGSRGWCDGDFIVIAREELRRYSFLHITLAKIEETVLIHEFGHAMGLVSNPAHDYRHHCTNPSCVMYYEPDFRCILANSVSVVFGSVPTEFCDECCEDLRRLRGADEPRK